MVEPAPSADLYPMDTLLARLSEQQAILREQNEALRSADDEVFCRASLEHTSSSTSLPITPATDVFPSTAPTTRPASAALNDTRATGDELLRLKLELAQAHNKISRLDQELAHTRTVKQEPGTYSSAPLHIPTLVGRENSWGLTDDDNLNTMAVPAFNRNRGIWSNPGPKPNFITSTSQPGHTESSRSVFGSRGLNNNGSFEPHGPYAPSDTLRADHLTPDPEVLARAPAGRRARFDNRNHTFSGSFGNFGPPGSHFDPMAGGPINGLSLANMPPSSATGLPNSTTSSMTLYPGYHPQPIGTSLSPHATEFTAAMDGWKSEVRSSTFLVSLLIFLFFPSCVGILLTPSSLHRPSRRREDKPMFLPQNLSTTVAYLIAA